MSHSGGGRWRGDSLVNKMPTFFDTNLVTVVASLASSNSGDLSGFAPYTSATFVLDVTAAATEVDDTLNAYVQRKLPNGDYEDIASFTQVLGNGGAKTFRADVYAGASAGSFSASINDGALAAGSVADLAWGDKLRVKWVQVDAGGSADSFSFTVDANFRV